MNKRLQKKIKAYAGFASVLLASDKTNGQVVYVDVNPDTLVSAQPLNSGLHYFLLDVNSDAVMDFNFAVLSFTTSSGSTYLKEILITPQNGNQVGNKLYFFQSYSGASGYYPFPVKLNAGDTLDINGIWESGPSQQIVAAVDATHGATYGVWDSGDDNYLPFQLVQGSNHYYGWLRIEVITRSSFLLKEYAYCTIPNIALRAGFTTITSVHDVETSVSVIFNQYDNIVKINFTDYTENAVIKVFDLTGKNISNRNFSGSETEVTLTRKGIYFVEVKSEKGIFRKKVFIY